MKNTKPTKVYMGIDLGDGHSQFCALNWNGTVIREQTVASSGKEIHDFITEFSDSKTHLEVVLEVGTHSPWVERLLRGLAKKVIVCDPATLHRLRKGGEKSDRTDARVLAELLRCRSTLLRPVEHRNEEHQVDWTTMVSRAALVECRTKLVNSVRGSVKSLGFRLPSGITTGAFATKVKDLIPEKLQTGLKPLLAAMEEISAQIDQYDKIIERLATKKYLAAKKLKEIDGVGSVTALAFVLVIFNAKRFRHTRSVGKYIGLSPKLEQSGESDQQLGITKAGNPMLRRLLVQCAHQILGPFGADCDLRRWGTALAARGGKNAKKRAVIAVARRLSVKMLAIWKSGAAYDPDYDTRLTEQRLRKAS